MFDNDSADGLEPRAATIECILHPDYRVPRTNEEPVTLLLKFAGRGSPFWKATNKQPQLKDKSEALSRAAKLFAQHAIAGWLHVNDDDGKPIPYTPTAGHEMFMRFIARNRQDLLDGPLWAAQQPDNFREPIVEANELGKG